MNFCPHSSRERTPGFSLTEVVVAMGVATVAFTTIIGLFPLGLNMSKESYESVQAALLAQTIMADMKDQQTGNRTLRVSPPYQYKLLQVGANSDPHNDNNTNYRAIFINITAPQTNYLAYNQLHRNTSDTDAAGKPIMLRPCAYSSNTVPGWYPGGSNGLLAVAKVIISPSCRFQNTSGGGNQPVRIDVQIETPGNANLSNRTCYSFTGVARP